MIIQHNDHRVREKKVVLMRYLGDGGILAQKTAFGFQGPLLHNNLVSALVGFDDPFKLDDIPRRETRGGVLVLAVSSTPRFIMQHFCRTPSEMKCTQE